MLRTWIVLIAALIVVAWQEPVEASADFGCAPSWKLDQSSATGCDNVAILGPANDTRVNFTMLLADRLGERAGFPASAVEAPLEPLFSWFDFRTTLFPLPEDRNLAFAWGEGSRCRSNEDGAAAFEAALDTARRLPAEERTLLREARRALRPDCAGASAGGDLVARAIAEVRSPDGKAFAAYLDGALAFYDADYDRAAGRFGELAKTRQPWLRETARYMLGRVEVNRAQIDAFDDYGFPRGPEHVDQAVIDAADAALRRYIEGYPRGLYTRSATGLLRRVYWLGGRTDRLAAEYAALFRPAVAFAWTPVELAEEIDDKLLPRLEPAQARDPLLLAVVDLKRMRGCEGEACRQRLTRAELEAQRAEFAKDPALFAYLRAVHAFHVDGAPQEALRLLGGPDADGQPGYLAFSRKMLRLMARTKLGQPVPTAEWEGMVGQAVRPYQRGAAELGLALHLERTGQLDRLFAPGSQVRLPSLRAILLTNVAGADLLRRQSTNAQATAAERNLALFTLLYKELTRGAYDQFLADLALVPAGAPEEGRLYDLVDHSPVGIFAGGRTAESFPCPSLRDTAALLARDPKQPTSLLCLGEFMRLNGLDDFTLDHQPPADELGGSPSGFPGSAFSRLELYKEVMADPKAGAGDRAYALYRAIHCYAPSGNNSCGGREVPVAERRAWFQRLKRDYPQSQWARAARYYW